MFCDLGTILPLYRSGHVNIIAVATLDHLALLPGVPTIDESGVKGFDSTTFYSLMAPPGTPVGLRNKLNKAIVAAMQTPDAQAKLKGIFVEASTLDPAAMGEYLKAQVKQWGDVIRAANISVDQ
jgi:tripartite-type tricarboxylate transporter receptor subunit TctC